MFGEGETGKAAEIVETPPSPLAERLRDFRDGVGTQPDEDKPTAPERPEGEEPETTGEDREAEGEQQDEETKEQEEVEGDEQGDQGDEGGKQADDEEEADAAGAKPQGRREPEFSVDVPTLNADGAKGPAGAGVLRLDGLPQEYRDAIASHVKRSFQLDGVLQRLEQARELETVARFYQADPLNAMRLVAAEKPELASQFVQSWILQNPKATKALMKTLKIDTEDEEKLELRGKLAAQTMREELATAYDKIDAGTAQQAYVDLSRDVVDDLVAPLQLGKDDVADFEQLAGARIVADMNRRVAARQSPYATRTELLQLLQPLIQKFTGAPAGKKGKPKTGTPAGDKGLTREEMEKRGKQAEHFRRVRGGGTGTGVRPSGMKKTKLPPSLGERIKLLRAGKL